MVCILHSIKLLITEIWTNLWSEERGHGLGTECIQSSAGTDWKDKSEGLIYRTNASYISTKIDKSFNIISLEKHKSLTLTFQNLFYNPK